jgi:hypothetical protein
MLDEQICLFDSIRRTKVQARVIRLNKYACLIQLVEQEFELE